MEQEPPLPSPMLVAAMDLTVPDFGKLREKTAAVSPESHPRVQETGITLWLRHTNCIYSPLPSEERQPIPLNSGTPGSGHPETSAGAAIRYPYVPLERCCHVHPTATSKRLQEHWTAVQSSVLVLRSCDFTKK